MISPEGTRKGGIVVRRKPIFAAVIGLTLLWSDGASAADHLAGRASVIDGDTIEIHGVRIRLFAIDAPEGAQRCKDAAGADWRCGRAATFALSDRIGTATVTCDPRDRDRYGRVVAVCWARGVDLNEWLVREGWAVAYRSFSRVYVRAEASGRAEGRGIWAGTFDLPADWRRARK